MLGNRQDLLAPFSVKRTEESVSHPDLEIFSCCSEMHLPLRTSQMIILQANKNCAQETGMIRPSLEDQFTELNLGQSTAFCCSVHKRRRKGREERQLWGSQWYRTGGGDREKDQKSLAFKLCFSEQVFLCWMCSLSMLGGATTHKLNGFPPEEHEDIFCLAMAECFMLLFTQWLCRFPG